MLIYDETRTVSVAKSARLLGGLTVPAGAYISPVRLYRLNLPLAAGTVYVVGVTEGLERVVLPIDHFAEADRGWLLAALPVEVET